MRIDVVTIFPGMFEPVLGESIIKRAREQGFVEVELWDLRRFTDDRHRTTDDYAFGGGGGMVMKPEPIFRAVEAISSQASGGRVILLTPQGRAFNQDIARELARERHLILLCGRYEGVDDRVRARLAADELSIGDYVLTGGELPAMVVIDAVVRLIPGVLGQEDAPAKDTFGMGILEGPHFTRPREFQGMRVPDILLSGNHGAIAQWRRREALRRTLERRPELLKRINLDEADRELVREIVLEMMS